MIIAIKLVLIEYSGTFHLITYNGWKIWKIRQTIIEVGQRLETHRRKAPVLF